MKYFRKENIGKSIAIISFVIGTILLVLYFFTYNPIVSLIGYVYVVLIVIINIAVFISGLIEALKNRPLRKRLLINNAIMILNIPIALGYFYIILFLFNTVKLTLINNNNSELTNLKINGCEKLVIDNLNPGDKKTVWISTRIDCNVTLTYDDKDRSKKEIILGNATSMGGIQIKHEIGKRNQKI